MLNLNLHCLSKTHVNLEKLYMRFSKKYVWFTKIVQFSINVMICLLIMTDMP